MQAPPLVTAARLVALSQVIWGKWATQWRCRDTIETVQSIGYKGYKHLKLRVCNFSSRVFKSLNVEKQPLLEEKKREEGGLPSFPFPLLVCLLISSCSILSHSLVFSGLLQQQAAPAVGPAHSYSCQGPSCHTTESWIKKSQLCLILLTAGTHPEPFPVAQACLTWLTSICCTEYSLSITDYLTQFCHMRPRHTCTAGYRRGRSRVFSKVQQPSAAMHVWRSSPLHKYRG